MTFKKKVMVNWPKFVGMKAARSGPAQKLEAEQAMDGGEHRCTESDDSALLAILLI